MSECCDDCQTLKVQLEYKTRIEKELRETLDNCFLHIGDLERKIQELRRQCDYGDFKVMHG